MNMMRRLVFLLFALFCIASVSAQDKMSNSIFEQLAAISDRYKSETSINGFAAKGGIKLQTVKLMLRKEFGREFVDNIKFFVALFYEDAQPEVVEKILADIAQVTKTMQCVNIGTELKPGSEGLGYVRLSEDGQALTDLLIVSEAPSPKFVYFGGRFKPENLQYNPK